MKMDDPKGDPWTWLAARVVYDNPWIRVEERQGRNPAGAAAIYGIVRMKRLAVGILPINAQGEVYLVGQWRPALEAYSWEIPEGGADPGEAPDACARRELEEETGLRAGSLMEILRFDVSNSVTDERAILFLATDLAQGQPRPEPTEVLSQSRLPFAEVLARVLDGRISDSLTVAAMLKAHHMAVTGVIAPDLARAMLPDWQLAFGSER